MHKEQRGEEKQKGKLCVYVCARTDKI
jgi:hypothetical protein